MRIESVKNLINQFKKLPTVGPKTAQRFVYSLLNDPSSGELERFERYFKEIKEKIGLCEKCFNIAENNLCWICADTSRDHQTICLVEKPLNIVTIEEANEFKGVYHILGGKIDPHSEINLQNLHIKELLNRAKEEEIKEIILAFNPSADGEATALYCKNIIQKSFGDKIKITRLGRGLPTGGDIEYADSETIKGAFLGRQRV